MHAGKSQLYAMTGGMRKADLDVAFQLPSNHSGHWRHIKPRDAKGREGPSQSNGPDQKKHSNDWEEEAHADYRLLSGLLWDKKQYGHGNQIPQRREYPGADHAGAGAALDASLRPVVAPQPRFGRMLCLCALLLFQNSTAKDHRGHLTKTNTGENEAKDQQQPDLGMASTADHLMDRRGEGEQPEARKWQRKQEEEEPSEFCGAVQSRSLWR